MQDPIEISANFPSNDKKIDESTGITRSGQSVFMSVYRTKLADQSRLITITWCKNLLIHGLSVSVEGPEGEESHYTCKVELKAWYFWKKQGSKRFLVDGKPIDVFWDLKAAKFNGETEPISDYYVAIVDDDEVVLLLGDLKKDAYRKTGCRPALLDPVMVSRKEHVFGKRKFSTKIKLRGKGRFYDISIEFKNRGSSSNGVEPEMEIMIDGHVVIHVKHLQWKFRGKETINIHRGGIEVYWDVHDWLFSPGLRHALFIFKPFFNAIASSSSSSSTPLSDSTSTTPLSSQTGSSSGSAVSEPERSNASGSSEFSLFLYAWKIE